jgi:pentatricopeptide repeat protein
MFSEDCPPSEATLSVVISQLCQEGLLQQAVRLLEKMSKHECTASVATYNAVIGGLCEQGHVANALELLRKMQSCGCEPNTFTFEILVKGLCSSDRWDDTEGLCSPDISPFSTLIGLLCQRGLTVQAIEVFKQMPKKGCAPDSTTYSTLIDGLAKSGNMDQSLELLNEMGNKGFDSEINYKLLAEYLHDEAKIEEAIQMVHKLQDKGISPHTALYNTILLGLCRNGKTDHGIDILANMVSDGCMPDESTYIILIEGLAHEGYMKQSRELLSKLSSKHVLIDSLIKNDGLLLDQNIHIS